MVLPDRRRRHAFVDEVTVFQPGRRIALRTVEGPMLLDTACICQPDGDGCGATVVGAIARLPGGVLGRLAGPVLARVLRRGFRADLANSKHILEADRHAAA